MTGPRAHVIPVNDLREHEAEEDCWCVPVTDDLDPNLLVHNALDGRDMNDFAGLAS